MVLVIFTLIHAYYKTTKITLKTNKQKQQQQQQNPI